MGTVNNLVFLLCLCAGGATANKMRSGLYEVWNDLVLQTSNVGRCHSCARNRNLIENTLSEYEMKKMRLEIVKQTILKQLGMAKAPNIDPANVNIPIPVKEGLVDYHSPKIEQSLPNNDKIIVIASDVQCAADENELEISLTFNIPDYIHKINGAKLWIFTNKVKLDNCKIVISSCETENKRLLVSAILDPGVTDGWSELDLSWTLDENNRFLEKCFASTISCGNRKYHMEDFCRKISVNETSTKPFILVDVKQEEGVLNRGKRNINCTKGATECCRENLYVSFADIGWGDWIIRPSGYNAYYCKGNCANAATISLSGTPYHSVLRKIYLHMLSQGTQLDVTPCCTPRELSPVQLIYVDQNKTLHTKIIPNLVVNSCGCM